MFKHPLISLICLLTMLSGVGVLSGCAPSKATASGPAAAATPVATATPATTTYASSDGQYSLQYPTGWMVKVSATPKTSGIVLFSSSGAVEQLQVVPFTAEVVPDYQVLLKDALSNPTYFQNAKVDTTTTTASYPSGSWTVASATVVLTGDPYMARLYGIVHSGHTVMILTLAPSSSATTDQTTYFAPMLTSFAFLK